MRWNTTFSLSLSLSLSFSLALSAVHFLAFYLDPQTVSGLAEIDLDDLVDLFGRQADMPKYFRVSAYGWLLAKRCVCVWLGAMESIRVAESIKIPVAGAI